MEAESTHSLILDGWAIPSKYKLLGGKSKLGETGNG